MRTKPLGEPLRLRLTLAFGALVFLATRAPLSAGVCGTIGEKVYAWTASGQLTRANNCFGGTGFRCYPPESTGYFIELASPGCNPSLGSCQTKIHALATNPGVADMVAEDTLSGSPTPRADWHLCSGAACPKDITCGESAFGGKINADNLDTTLSLPLTCAQARTFNTSVKIRVCSTACPSSQIIDIPAPVLAAALGCAQPLFGACSESSDGTSGAAALTCKDCHGMGGDTGCSSSDGNLSCVLWAAGNAQLRYAGSGVGGDNLPGTIAWRTILGRFWSHDYAERIVVDPDSPAPGHVWLLTRFGTFREFSNLAGGGGLRLYQNRAPSDEFRKLYFDTATSGWQLKSLDGRTDSFRADGLWEKTVLAQDPSNPTQAFYNGSNQLTLVDFPDGRSDSFTYAASGKLETITTVPVPGSGTPTRTWTLTWSGDELIEILRPDGKRWVFTYDSGRPGYLLRIDLASGPEWRNMASFSYLAGTNLVETSWRGDPSFSGPNSVDKTTFAYTNPSLPTQIVVTSTVSGSFNRVTTYAVGRDTVSSKPKVTSIQGTCPTCGLSPTTTFAYAGSNPLLPSSMTDAKGTRTDYTYDGDGRMLTKVEAANVLPLARTTTYTYGETNFPGLVTKIEVPSTDGVSGHNRSTSFDFGDTTGRLVSRTIDGFEAGAALPDGSKVTSYTTNSSGEVLTVDPSGFTTADVTTFTYNLTGRNGHIADSRTDPNPPGSPVTTIFGYDGLNRRTSVIDANGIETTTLYDELDRVLEVRQKGDTPLDTSDDLVTSYTHNDFKDLFCTKLPNGNGIQYDYDTARRLVSVVRGTAIGIPTPTTCLDAALPRERTAYTLDKAGNRIEESLERWNSGTSTWDSESKTAYVYTCHLDKVTQGAGSSTTTVTEYCHDLNDNLEKVWDGNHPKASNPSTPTQLYEYDELNRLKKVTVGVGTPNVAATNYTYDQQDHLASVSDAEGNATTYTTSDRDVLTQEVSPVSGTTNHEYNEHGQLKKTTDARSIETNRTIDAADRATQETYGPAGSPDPTLTVTYAYGATPAQFNVGRLTGITRNAQTVAYSYDPFGRTLQDGALVYEYDKNGNRKKVTYPGGVSASYTFDSVDRATGLTYDSGGGPQTLVSQVAYRALGPLSSLKLGTTPGLVETRTWDARYFVDRIQAGALMDWDYTLDAIGNPTGIAGTINGVSFSPTFVYQDSLYFLTQGNGPWGTRSWTYDKIGNRLTAARQSEPTQGYAYTGHNPKLQTVTPAPGWGTGSWAFTYDPAGNQTQLAESNDEGAVQSTLFDVAADGRMSALRVSPTSNGPTRTDMLYDGRGYLRQANATLTPPGDYINVTPVYSSDGMLYARTEQRQWSGGTAANGEDDPTATSVSTDTTQLFYFAGRPVAQLTNGSELLYLTTDHLGTPVLATDASGGVAWAGAVEPFGSTWTAAVNNPDPEDPPAPPPSTMLPASKVFLRYPGQWVSDAFRVTSTQQDIYYNIHRWYEPATGRYTSPDPMGRQGFGQLYGYAEGRPVRLIDRLGLFIVDPSCRQDCTMGKDVAAHGLIACGNIEVITDVALRDCVSEKCLTARIHCDDFFPGGCDRAVAAPGGRVTPPFAYAPLGGDRINLCPANWPGWTSTEWLADAILHEFSHLCRWDHGMRRGVPQDCVGTSCYPEVDVPNPPPWQPPPPVRRPWWRRIFGGG